MKITGGIVTYNNEATIEACISSVLQYTKDCDFQLYVADNASTDRTCEIVKKFPQVKLIRLNENLGFGAGHNRILYKCDSDFHVVINPDIELKENTILTLANYMMLPESVKVGLVTPKILNPDDTEQFLPKYGPTVKYCYLSKFPGFKSLRREYTRQDEDLSEPTMIEFCTGCFFGVRTDYFKRLGGFNKCFFMYCEDSDLSKRVLHDKKQIIFYPETAVYHHWNRENTRKVKGIIQFTKSLCMYFKKWGFQW